MMVQRITGCVALALLVAACNPTLTASSLPPPGRTARLEAEQDFWGARRYRIELSRGVVLALTCDRDGPCEHLRVSSDDPSIVEIRPASLLALESSALGGRAPSTAAVVIGNAPGSTTVRVRSDQGGRDIAVTVLAAPRAALRDSPLTR